MSKKVLVFASVFILLSIVLGAIAAHSLKNLISEELILSFEKGVKYMMYSGLGLLILGLNDSKFNFSLTPVYRCIKIGTVLFSGCIFIYIFHEQLPALKHFVHLVPIGGTLMIIGWAILLYKLLK